MARKENLSEGDLMTICPIALAVGCEKCPAFKFCPLTTVLGDQEEKEEKLEKNKKEDGREIE